MLPVSGYVPPAVALYVVLNSSVVVESVAAAASGVDVAPLPLLSSGPVSVCSGTCDTVHLGDCLSVTDFYPVSDLHLAFLLLLMMLLLELLLAFPLLD